jgi:hypothetical protein
VSALADRVRALLHGHERPGWMDERAARDHIYGRPRLIEVAPINQPRPGAFAEPPGARRELGVRDGPHFRT